MESTFAVANIKTPQERPCSITRAMPCCRTFKLAAQPSPRGLGAIGEHRASRYRPASMDEFAIVACTTSVRAFNLPQASPDSSVTAISNKHLSCTHSEAISAA